MSGFVFLTDDDGEPIDFVGPYWGEVLGSVFLEDDDGELIDFGGPYGPIDGEFINAVLPPQNTTAYEYSVAEGASDLLPVNIRAVVNPTTTPLAFLPFLAAHESVDLWFSDWATSRKEAMIAQAPRLAALKGTMAAASAFLDYVDAEVVNRITYPARFVIGFSALGVTPLNHPPFKSRYLVKITLKRKVNAFIVGRSALGRAAFRDTDQTPAFRAKQALLVAQGGDNHRDTNVTFAWRRHVRFGDAVPVGDAPPIGRYLDRNRL